MSEIKAIEKLRESSHLDDNKWTLENGEVVTIFGADPTDQNAVNWGEQWRKIADEIEAEIAERYMLLPVDADGVPIHVGDVVAAQDEQPFEVRAFQFDALGWFAIERLGSQWNVNQLHHVKSRTVEDVLADFARDLTSDRTDSYEHRIERLGTKYDDELREMLRGDA